MKKNQEPITKNQKSSRIDGNYSHRNLILWQKAQTLTLEIIQVVSGLPRSATADVLARQIIRSSSSIGANIAEGFGRYTPRAHANHLSIAKGSACETDNWLDLLLRSNLIAASVEQDLHALCIELIAMLTAKMCELEKLSPSNRVQEESVEWDV